jgi:ABC-2 type transport system permease protein
MRPPDWTTDGIAVAATTIRRRVRRKRRHPRRFALELVVLGALWLVVVARYVDPGGAGAAVGDVPAAVQTTMLSNVDALLGSYLGVEVRPFARAVVAAAWLVLVNFRAASVTSSVDDLEVTPVDLLSTNVRAVVLGETLAGNVRRLLRYGTHLVLGAAVYALGGGSLAALPISLVVLVVLQVSASLTGYVLGLATWAWLLGSPRRWAYRHVVGLPLRFGYLGFLMLVVFGYSPVAIDRLVAVGAAVPVGWTADLILVELSGVESDPLAGLVVAVGLAAATLPLFEATQRLANRVWFAEPAAGDGPLGGTTEVAADANRTVAERVVDALDRAVTPIVDRQTRAMARRSWTLVLRNPGRVYLAAVPLVIALFEVLNGANSGDASGPVIVAVTAGAVVCLAIVPSPFEFDSPVFPALLSSSVTGRQVVRAYLVTTSLLVLPLALVGALIAGLFAPTPPVVLAGGVALTLALVPAGSALSVGASVAMPSTRLAAGRTTVSLDRYAMAVALAVVLLSCAPAALVLAIPALLETVTVGDAVTAGGLAASVLLAATSGAVAYRYAAREFDTITL